MAITLPVGGFLPSSGETCFRTLDGSDVAAWLRAQGYEVLGHGDTGSNGVAITACGLSVSTNGYVSAAVSANDAAAAGIIALSAWPESRHCAARSSCASHTSRTEGHRSA